MRRGGAKKSAEGDSYSNAETLKSGKLKAEKLKAESGKKNSDE